MEPIFVAKSAPDLEKVSWLTHDCFFDLDQIRCDEVAQTLEFDFGRGVEQSATYVGITRTRSEDPSHFGCRLVIRCVRSHRIEDEAMVGVYDLNSVSYDEDREEVVVEANIPCVIRLQVETVHVEVFAPADLSVNEGGLSWYTDGVDVRAWLGQGAPD